MPRTDVLLVDTNEALNLCSWHDIASAFRLADAKERMRVRQKRDAVMLATYAYTNSVSVRVLAEFDSKFQGFLLEDAGIKVGYGMSRIFREHVFNWVFPNWHWHVITPQPLPAKGSAWDLAAILDARANDCLIVTNEADEGSTSKPDGRKKIPERARVRGVTAVPATQVWAGKIDERAAISRFFEFFERGAAAHRASTVFRDVNEFAAWSASISILKSLFAQVLTPSAEDSILPEVIPKGTRLMINGVKRASWELTPGAILDDYVQLPMCLLFIEDLLTNYVFRVEHGKYTGRKARGILPEYQQMMRVGPPL